MDEEQKRKFEEWARKEDFLKKFDGFSPTLTDLAMTAEKAWDACLKANKTKEVNETIEPEPSPTEMVWRLMGKGWMFKSGRDLHDLCLEDPKTKILYDFTDKDITTAYRKAFPPKKKIEVDVWLDSDGEVRIIPSNSDSKGLDPKRVSWGWTKGVATFWVEDSDG